MLAVQRHRLIVEELRRRGAVRVSDLTQLLSVSEMTIRRDFDALAGAGLLEKVHGGAALVGGLSAEEPGFEAKAERQLLEKEAIARHAAKLVEPGQAIGLTAGTTTWRLAQHLTEVPELTIVTNSIQVSNVFHLERRPDQTVVLIGGVRTPSDALVGPIAVSAIRSLHLDTLFMGVHGVTVDAGLDDAEPARGRDRSGAVRDLVAQGRGRRPHEVGDPRPQPHRRPRGGRHLRDRQRPRPRRPLGAVGPRPANGLRAAEEARQQRVSSAAETDLRTDDHVGYRTFVVGSRQDRPNLPATGCPFCPGGLEAPELYDVRWFVNRWPAMPADRCEVVLYTPQHDATFWSLGTAGARKVVDLWAEQDRRARGAGRRRLRAGVREPGRRRRGHDPPSPRPDLRVRVRPRAAAARAARGDRLDDPGDRLVAEAQGWRAWVPLAPTFPYALRLAPDDAGARPAVADRTRDATGWRRCSSTCSTGSTSCSTRRRRTCSGSTSGRSTASPGPRPGCTSRSSPRGARRGVLRYVAAGELGSGVYFDPVPPEAAAAALRNVR